MIRIGALRSRTPAVRTSRRVTRPPVTLTGPLLHAVRTFWIAMAALALVIWVVEVPLLYGAALHGRNASGLVNLSPSEWRAGLHRLGLSPSVYAIQAVATLSVMTLSMVLTGFLIFLRRSAEWIALLISLTFVTLGAGIINAYAGGAALGSIHPALEHLVHLFETLAVFPYYALFLIPLLFPDGHFVPHWTRWLAGILLPLQIAQSIAPGFPLGSQHWPVWLAIPLNLFAFATILLSPVYRYRRVSDREQREQSRWVMFGIVVALGLFFAFGLVRALAPGLTATPDRAVLFELIGSTIVYLGLTFLPITFAIAILWHRLWDIDLILNRALVYTALTASVIGLYVLVVVGLGSLFGMHGNILLSLVATALVAILFHPLHGRLQRGVNRLLYGARNEPYEVLSRLGQQLGAALAPDAVLPSLVETVAQVLKLPYVAIDLQHNEEFVVVAETGATVAAPLHIPLLYRGETIGELIVGPRAGEETFSRSERSLLDDLARQAGVATYAVRLTSDLQRSRERLVTAREEERRRLRRDLHDGLGPALASVTLMADAARNLMRQEPDAAEVLLRDLKVEAQAATAEVRRVVYELRPPALDELGLVGALREQAAQYCRGGVNVSVEAPESFPPLPAAVEVAAYRIAQEAMTNVMRHADARVCTVRLGVDGDLRLEIADDGRGLNGARPGVGLTSMRERAEELGGRCMVERGQARGTTVRAILPMARE